MQLSDSVPASFVSPSATFVSPLFLPEDLKIVLLGLVYPKNEKDDLTASEREEIRKLLAEIHEQYSQHHDQ